MWISACTALCLIAALSSPSDAAVHGTRVPSGSSGYPFRLAHMGPHPRSWFPWFRGSLIQEHIVGGHDAQRNQFPHQVSMQVTLAKKSEPQHICGGALVAKNWVLTAAHCVYGVPSTAKKVQVVVGITNLAKDKTPQRIDVAKMLTHEQYRDDINEGIGPFDIALLKLATDVVLSDSVRLAALPAEGAIPTGESVLSGWGSTSKDQSHPIYPDQLQFTKMNIMNFELCNNDVARVASSEGVTNPLAESNLCTGEISKTDIASCNGDSGGPLVQNVSGETVVVGVVSWGLGDCGSFPFPSVFTRVSAFIPWIQTSLKNNL